MPNQANLKATKKNKKGSALVFSLIILSMMLTIAMSLSSATVMQKKNASSTQFSVQAYQAADGAAQLALRAINKNLLDTAPLHRTLLYVFSFATCDNNDAGVFVINGFFGTDTKVELSFFDVDGNRLTCNRRVDDIISIHAIAKHLDTVRAVKLAVSKISPATAWWMFDNGPSGLNGTIAIDSSGNSHDGTLVNMASPATATSGLTATGEGKINEALNFDGIDDYVIADVDPGGITNATGYRVTMSAWVRPTAYGGAIIAAGKTAGIGNGVDGYGMFLDTTGHINIGVEGNRNFTSAGTLPLNSWSHIVGILGSDVEGKIYINATLDANKGSSYPAMQPTTSRFKIGADSADDINFADYFKGSIDNVKIFSYAVTKPDVNAEYQSGLFACLGDMKKDFPNATAYTTNKNIEDISENVAFHYSAIDTTGAQDTKCQFGCDDGYDWNGAQCIVASCTGALPPFSTVFDLTGNNNNPLKNTAYSYSNSNTSTACEFYCDDGYDWNGTECRVAKCTGTLPAIDALLFGGDNTTLTEDKPYVYSNSDTATKCEFACATGDTYDSITNTCKLPAPTTIDYLVVAGGGGGGGANWSSNVGAGGGAGGLLTSTSVAVSPGTYAITVGNGGAGGAAGLVGGNGGNSSIMPGGIVATGGGGGAPSAGSSAFNGVAGGSGGGGRTNGAVGGAGIAGQGKAGGSCSAAQAGAGGGGAGAVGVNVTSGGMAGAGGAGLSNNITGIATVYAGGGGGGGTSANGAGGSGGGGAGGVAGTANTGGGGGGRAINSAGPGLAGGSGVVVIRYPSIYADAISVTGAYTYTNTGTDKIYKWTSSGSVIFTQSGKNGQSAATAASSCRSILAEGYSTGDGTYWIKPVSYGGSAFQVYCDMVTDGGGYTYYLVSSGIATSKVTDNDTCKTLGMNIVIPRTQAQFTTLYAKYGASYFATVPGVYGTVPGNYTGCIMRDPASYGSGCANWLATDGGKWWLRDSVYSEPNGDYTAGCWLGMNAWSNPPVISALILNDYNCTYSTSSYICSTNDK